MSLRKKREVIESLSKQFNILKEEVTYWKFRLNVLALELKDTVKKFYEWNDISRMCPRKQNVVSVRFDDGEKVKLQKQHLYSSLKETHAIFQAEYL